MNTPIGPIYNDQIMLILLVDILLTIPRRVELCGGTSFSSGWVIWKRSKSHCLAWDQILTLLIYRYIFPPEN